MTISKTPSNEYYASVLVEQEISVLDTFANEIGFDLGLKEFIVTSNGEHIEDPKILSKYEDGLKNEGKS